MAVLMRAMPEPYFSMTPASLDMAADAFVQVEDRAW
jgi:hypothetical protein